MALIPKYHLVAAHFSVTAHQEIIAGMVVKLDVNGSVVIADGSTNEVALGLAGDTKSTSVSGLPSTNASSQGAFVNRVSDTFDETKASGRMTVYHSGGEFATNEYEAGTYAINDPLYVSANGKLTKTPNISTQIIGYVTQVPGPYDRGVRGLDTLPPESGSMSLGNYLELKLVI